MSGVTAAIGVLIVALLAGLAAGQIAAAAAMVGAMCVSIVDIPDPPEHKPPGFITASLGGGLITVAVGLSGSNPWLLVPIIAATSFGAAMVTVYGRTTLPLCMAMILALVLALGAQVHAASTMPALKPADAALRQAMLFTFGGIGYAVYGILTARILEMRYKRLALIDALQAFAAYIRCKAGLYDPAAEIDLTYGALIERQVTLMERVQTARNLLFRQLRDAQHEKMAAALVLLIDAFESVLSSQGDFVLLRRHYGDTAFLGDIRDNILAAADRLDALAQEVRGGSMSAAVEPLRRNLGRIAGQVLQSRPVGGRHDAGHESERARAELNAVLVRVTHSLDILVGLQKALRDPAVARSVLGRIDLAAFLPPQPYRLRTLLRQIRFRSPIFRYALRLTGAMLCAFAVAETMTRYFHHGSWILLTVAVIMRASYSATRQRQKDRLIGNLIGCVLAAVALRVLPEYALLGIIFLGIGAAHAYAAVRYRITSIAGAVMALLLLHFLDSGQEVLLIERLLDTAVGAAIAFLFSFVLPSWERQTLQDRVAALLRANRRYAHQSLRLALQEQAYRLARKQAFDAIGDFAGMIRRIPQEPGGRRYDIGVLQSLLVSNYRLSGLLAALQLLLRRRRGELPPVDTERRLAQSHVRLRRLLGGSVAELPATPMPTAAPFAEKGRAAAALDHRLHQAEEIATQIHALAGKLAAAAPLPGKAAADKGG
ncbi:MAG TPA: FUSC family membrane protein [Ferrovibrio sp.]|uniref:FUSC family protein n=1 Tax=Ferrovibrio sp. TaxID=1917215 RepID=UPI002ED59052